MIRNTSNGWGSVSRWLHWILALTIVGMIGFGWWMNHIPARPDRFFYRSIHADIGYLILDTNKALSLEVKSKIEALQTSIKTRILY